MCDDSVVDVNGKIVGRIAVAPLRDEEQIPGSVIERPTFSGRSQGSDTSHSHCEDQVLHHLTFSNTGWHSPSKRSEELLRRVRVQDQIFTIRTEFNLQGRDGKVRRIKTHDTLPVFPPLAVGLTALAVIEGGRWRP